MFFSRLKIVVLASLVVLFSTPNVLAIDPPYQEDMERFASIMGALYHLDDLCVQSGNDWRAEMDELMTLEEVDEDRRARLTGAFNDGYNDFSRFHVQCTQNARLAMERFVDEGANIAKNIHTRFAE
ncbi:TIGR02301 family protein [Maritalea sp.]|uniref:TIGR02301 family protein n=1 Tax=Maritalea sp. TaxID=2003361 RepID=UPI003EF5E826